MRRISAIAILFCLAACNAPALPPGGQAWLKENAVPVDASQPGGSVDDLMPLKKTLGDARIVALGEATHSTHEFFQMKQRLFEFLVTQMGFNTFAIEAGWPEANRLNDYVRTGKGDPAKPLAGFDEWTANTQEMLDLVNWMEAYNQDPRHSRKLSFTGFDLQIVGTAADDVIQYLRQVDPEAALRLSPAYDCLRPYDLAANKNGPQEYAALPPETRAACRKGLQAVADWLSQERAVYEARTSPESFAQALQAARSVLETEGLYSDPSRRDQYMAENVAWLLDQAGPDARMVVSAHNGHVGTTVGASPVSMGDFLRQKYGSELVTVGFVFYQGTFNAIRMDNAGTYGNLTKFQTAEAPRDDIETAFHSLRMPRFILDLRGLRAGAPGTDWLLQPHSFRNIGAVYNDAHPEYFFETAVLPQVFDLIVYFQDTTAARILGRDVVQAQLTPTVQPFQR